jgi:hypothetical protein
MYKFLKSFALVMVLLAVSVIPALAQTQTVRTTLSAAISAGQTNTTISVTSTTGMTASTNSAQTFILVDKEIMRVVSLSPFVVSRGEMASTVSAHASGSYVFYGKTGAWSNNTGNAGGVFLSRGEPIGSCTRTANEFLPIFTSSKVFDCNGGVWIQDTLPIPVTVAAVRQCVIPIGSLALTAYGTDTVNVSGTIYIASIDIPKTRVVTTLSNLTGTTAPTTDKQLFALYDSGGKLIASTPVAGLEAATADIFFDQAITRVNGVAGTAPTVVAGRYFLATQFNGTTTSMQKIAIATGYQHLIGNSRTGTFGTLPALTVPTTLVDVAAPIACVS